MSPNIQFEGQMLFGPFELKNETAELFKDGQQVRLSRQSALLLVILVQRAGQLVSREELRVALWPEDTYVDFDHGLNNCISRIRQALGDSIDLPTYIQTLPKQGYRFIGKVRIAAGQANHGELLSNLSRVNSEADFPAKPPFDAPTEKAPTSKTPGEFWSISNRGLRIALGICAFCVLVIAAVIYLLKPPPPREDGFRFGPFGIEVVSPLWSPDGNALVYSAKINGHRQLFLRYLNSPVGVQLTHMPPSQWGTPATLGWSNDNSHVLFAKKPDPLKPSFSIISVATVGGAEQLIMDRIMIAGCPCLSSTLTRDGKVFAFFSRGEDGKYGLKVSDPLGTPPRPYLPAPFATRDFSNTPTLRFSWDGKKILLFVDGDYGRAAWLLPYPAGSTPPRRLPQRLSGFSGTPSFDWMLDNRHIVISMPLNQSSPAHLWMMDTESDDIISLTGGAEGQVLPKVAPGGKSLIYAQPVDNLSVISLSVPDGWTKALIGAGREESMASWSANTARLVWVSNRNGPYEIWLRDAEGKERPVVTAAEFPAGTTKWFIAPALSPDGERIIYQRIDNSGVDRLWISSLSGGMPVRLTNVEPDGESPGSWSPDGEQFVYVQAKGGKTALMMVKAIGNATPHTLRDSAGNNNIPDWSPLGHWITYVDEKGWNLISPDGKASKFLGQITTDYLTFAKDEKLLYGIRHDDAGPDPHRGVLFSLDHITLKQKVIKDLDESLMPGSKFSPGIRVSFAPDGKSLAYTIDKSRTDWWILDDLPQPDWRDQLRGMLRVNFTRRIP